MNKLIAKIKAAAPDLIWLVLVTLLAGFVFTDDIAAIGGGLWDNGFFISLFHNHIDSIYRYGQLAYWFPANQLGWPAYYYSILGDIPVHTPVFTLISLGVWIAGRLNLEISTFGLFTFYYGYLVPAVVNVAVLVVARMLFHSRMAVWFAVLLSAFSPGVLVNISDMGFLEPVAYGLFFFAAWLRFIRQAEDLSFWLLIMTACILVLNIGFPFLIWNMTFVPLSVLLATFVPDKGWEHVKRAVVSRPLWQWAAGGAMILLAMAPALLTFINEKDLIRSTIGTQVYDFRVLRPGNPFEMFAISLPNFGFEFREKGWALLQGGQGDWISSGYIGLLVLPLTLVALVFGRKMLRVSAIVFLVIFACGVSLSAWNPLFSLVIRMVRPLQSNTHWPDLGFRGGFYLMFIFLATMGFELLEHGHRKAIRLLPWMITLSLAGAVGIYAAYQGREMFSNTSFGAMMVFSLALIIASVWLGFNQNRRMRKMVIGLLLALTTLEVSTFGFIHMRNTIKTFGYKVLVRSEQMDPVVPGLLANGADFAERLLMLAPHFDLLQAELNPYTFANYKLFDAARTAKPDSRVANMVQEKKLIESVGGFDNYASLLLDGMAKDIPEFAPYLANAQPSRVTGGIEILRQTYNDLDLKVNSSASALLFVRDAYSPHWKIWVNGKRVPVARALFNYKAIPIPQGASTIEMRFEPTGVRATLWAIYLILIGLALYCFRLHRLRRV